MTSQLNYAGVDLLIPTPEIEAWVDSLLPLMNLHDIQPPSPVAPPNLQKVALLLPNKYPEILVNQWFYPAEASCWSIFYGLANKQQVDKLSQDLLQGSVSQRPTAGAFKVLARAGTTATNLLQTQMYMLPPRPLPATQSSTTSLYLVTLVDERFFFPWRNSGQIRPAATTWDGLISTLATALGGITITADATPSVYGDPDQDSGLYANYENPALLLDAVAYNTGRVVVRNLDGTYKLQTYANANTAAGDNRFAIGSRVSGGRILTEDTSAKEPARCLVLPEKIIVSFPKVQDGVAFIDTSNRGWIKDSYGEVYTKEIALSSLSSYYASFETFTGLSKPMRDTAKALYPTSAGTDPPTNQTALDALATQIAKDFVDAQVFANDEVYPGIFAPSAMEGVSDYTWTFRADRPTTRVATQTWNNNLSEFQHELGGTVSPPGLTVQEVDGAPSVTGVTTLQFDQADGFIVSSPGAGIAKIDITPGAVPLVTKTVTGTVAAFDNYLADQYMGTGAKWFTCQDTQIVSGVVLYKATNNQGSPADAGNTHLRGDAHGLYGITWIRQPSGDPGDQGYFHFYYERTNELQTGCTFTIHAGTLPRGMVVYGGQDSLGSWQGGTTGVNLAPGELPVFVGGIALNSAFRSPPPPPPPVPPPKPGPPPPPPIPPGWVSPIRVVSGNATITNADNYSVIKVIGGNATLTADRPQDLGEGFSAKVLNGGSGTVTIQPVGGGVIENPTGYSSSLTLVAGETLEINSTGALLQLTSYQRTTSRVMDDLGTTRGSVIYKGASSWAILPPSAVAGTVLTAHGVGTDPTWATAVLSGVADGDYGDITVTGGVWTIDSGVVDSGKMKTPRAVALMLMGG